MRVSMHKIGEVIIDSGQVMNGDPCYAAKHPELCVTADTGIGDGTFDVVAMEVDGIKYVAVRLAMNLDGVLVSDVAKEVWPKSDGSQEDQTE